MRKIILLLTLGWLITVLVNFAKFNLLLVLFILFAAAERFWETFIIAKQNIFDTKSKFDWLFRILSYYYILIMFGTVIEYLVLRRRLNYPFVLAGGAIFIFALVLRLWAIKTLGGNWNTCVLGKIKRKFKPRKIIKKGPYHIFRHPIYLGTAVETLSIPLIFNSLYTLGFVILVYVPLVILRAYLEEQELIKIFGKDYLKYKAKTL